MELDSLSDDELCAKLNHYGISSPVTSSTRLTLIKRLKTIIGKSERGTASEQYVGPRLRRTAKQKKDLNLYSSDEEEQGESGKEKKLDLILRKKFRNHFPNFAGSHSEDEFSGRKNTVSQGSNKQRSSNVDFRQSHRWTTTINSYKYDSLESDVSDSEPGSFSSGNGGVRSNSDSSDSVKLPNDYSYQNKSLRAISESIFRSPVTTQSEESDTNISTSVPDSFLSSRHRTPVDRQRNGHSTFYDHTKLADDGEQYKKHWFSAVPVLLLLLLISFFCFLTISYIRIQYSDEPLQIFPLGFSFQFLPNHVKTAQIEQIADETLDVDESQNLFPVCQDETQISCLTKEELTSVTELLGLLESTILPRLNEQVCKFQCGQSTSRYLTTEDFKSLIETHLPEVQDLSSGVSGFEKLTVLNPHWGVTTIYSDKVPTTAVVGFGLSSPPSGLLCCPTTLVYRFFYGVVAAAAGLFCVWLSVRLFNYYREVSKINEQKSFELVEKILDTLESSCGVGGKEFVAVSHVRDYLIPPRERLAKAAVWKKAIQFIDQHDSRVYREVRSVGGEDCDVWKWVSGAPRSPVYSSIPPSASSSSAASETTSSPASCEKAWQGQAFKKFDVAQNVPSASPSSCLKVRNMFKSELEFEDDWHCRIQDSLLRKCESAFVVHIAIDKNSREGCVYMKCLSATEAGRAYRALHGWWYDGNLVTVKYLREERYFERFPSARNATIQLVPSED